MGDAVEASLSGKEGEKRPRAPRGPGHRRRVQGGAGGPKRRTGKKWHEAEEQRREGIQGASGTLAGGGAGAGRSPRRRPLGVTKDPPGQARAPTRGMPDQSAVKATGTGGSEDGRLVFCFLISICLNFL